MAVENFTNKDLLTINLTLIIGLLVLLTVTNYVETTQLGNTQGISGFLKDFPYVRIMAATTVLPFLASSIVTISFSLREFKKSSREFVEEEQGGTKKKDGEVSPQPVDSSQEKKNPKTHDLPDEQRRRIAFLTGLKWMKAGLWYLLLILCTLIILAIVYYFSTKNSM